MGKILFYIYDDMADFEFNFAANILGAFAGKNIITVAEKNEAVRSRAGLTYLADVSTKEALDISDVEGLIITGGWTRICSPELTELIKKVYGGNKLVAAICAGPEFLIKSGILKKHKYTTTMLPEEYLKENKEDPFPRENFLHRRVVRDKNLITAVGSAFIDFAIEIADWYGLFDSLEEKKDFANNYKVI